MGETVTADSAQMVTINPEVMGGAACVRGTRIPIEMVIAGLLEGMTWEHLQEHYPSLPSLDELGIDVTGSE